MGIFATLHVPVCVLSTPFWDVSIDRGEVGEPEIRTRAYRVLSYPSFHTGGSGPSEDALVVVIHCEELPALVVALEGLFESFVRDTQTRGWKS